MPRNTAAHNLAEQITAAVDKIPALLAVPEDTTEPNRILSWMDPRHSQKRRWLWSGVSVFVVAIIGIWIVNTQSLFQQVREQGFPEKILLERAKADSEQIMNAVEAKADLQTIAAARQKRESNAHASLQAALRQIIDSANAASATSTIAPAPSSTKK